MCVTRMGQGISPCVRNVTNAAPTGICREVVPTPLSPISLTMKALFSLLPSWHYGVSVCV